MCIHVFASVCVCMHVCAVIVLLCLKFTDIDVGILQHFPVIVPDNLAEWLSPVLPTSSEELPTGTELAPESEVPTPPQSVWYSLQKVRYLYGTIPMCICC